MTHVKTRRRRPGCRDGQEESRHWCPRAARTVEQVCLSRWVSRSAKWGEQFPACRAVRTKSGDICTTTVSEYQHKLTAALHIRFTVPCQETKIPNEKEASSVANDNFKIIFDKQKSCENDYEEKGEQMKCMLWSFYCFGLDCPKQWSKGAVLFFSSSSHLINYFILEHSKKNLNQPNTDVDKTWSILNE